LTLSRLQSKLPVTVQLPCTYYTEMAEILPVAATQGRHSSYRIS